MAFVIKNEQLTSAADKYSTASSNYEKALGELLNAMAGVTWSDESGATWQEVKASAEAQLKLIGENLASNSALLSQVASKAAEAQASVKSAIGSIY